MNRYALIVAVALVLFVQPAGVSSAPVAALPQAAELVARVLDVGAGLCVVIEIPGDDGKHYIVYDAGNYDDKGKTAMAGIEDVVGDGEYLDMLVLSHSDADHLGAVPKIVDDYYIGTILRGGLERSTATWNNADDAIDVAESAWGKGATVIDLSESMWPPGATWKIGDALVTMVCGFEKPPADFGTVGKSENRNAGSIVLRVYYAGKSILIAGDAVGRHIGGPAGQLIATERFMIELSPAVPIDSDVLIAPHHGADNGSATDFIKAVSPKFVIFSAGHRYDHPRKATAERYIANGVKKKDMFRTDRGDDEGAAEWDNERVAGTSDKKGDDDVVIKITSAGKVSVEYMQPAQ